ncbi:hypothetical protein FHS95_002086 [Sphingomonas naasensis]|uniref:Uncharacterized protein n=1 Tax=Sphingomonas naasensis TaxID=1344951 RepID=A0A4V6RB43_9SPHN|nr:hypothetical protein [Sphingomonas naasensis]NIJ20394.1 hypothetical protein [Sphingomonas naasensis]TGX44502.1 hypothetical protein E5A74_06910 [Sphingomonas naasensis]
MANSNSDTTNGSGNASSASETPGAEKSFIASAQEAIGDAAAATVQAVKDHPVAAAAVAAGAAAAVGGAVYAATQLGGGNSGGGKESSSKK